MKEFWRHLKAAAKLWYDRDGDNMAAVTAYYSLFAVVPLLLLSVTMVSWLYSTNLVVDVFYDWGEILGDDLVALLHEAVVNLKDISVNWSVPFFGILFFSGMVIVLFNNVTSALNHIWSIPHRGFKGWLSKCLHSVIYTFIFELYLVASIGFSFIMSQISSSLGGGLSTFLSSLFFIIVTTVLFSMTYHFLSWEAPRLKSRVMGGFLASVILAVVKLLVVMYISITPVPGLFGAAGLILVLLLWVYVFACVFYFGAAFSRVYEDKLNQYGV